MAFLLFYTDPGSGMMLLQVLFAFAASLIFYFRKFFYKIFGKDSTAEELPEDKTVSKDTHNSASEV